MNSDYIRWIQFEKTLQLAHPVRYVDKHPGLIATEMRKKLKKVSFLKFCPRGRSNYLDCIYFEVNSLNVLFF